MNPRSLLLLAVILSGPAQAAPLVTISCERPKGYRTEYGASASERVQARIAKVPEPAPRYKEPESDGYTMAPTFVVERSERKVTIIWSEAPEDVSARNEAKAPNLPYCCDPPPAAEARIESISDNQITAVQLTEPNGINLYSFYPKLGMVFVASQGHEPSGKNADQLSLFAKCEFAWSGELQR